MSWLARYLTQRPPKTSRRYRAVIYSRFYGLYYTVRYPDFDHRGENRTPEEVQDREHLRSLLKAELSDPIREWEGLGETIPLPEFQTYEQVDRWGSIGEDLFYLDLEVECSAPTSS